MTTATLQDSWPPPAARPVIGRFIWKELRTLRGLALGIFVMATIEMLASKYVAIRQLQWDWMLISAFGATTLFVIGAAVVLFAIEREEGTTALLQLLPQNRPAMLLGKLTALVVMALFLLASLCVAVMIIAGSHASSGDRNTQLIVSQGFMAMAEALAWGFLASMLCPNPLLAVVLGIAAASISPQLAIVCTLSHGHGYGISDYQAAIPGRFALVAAAALIDAWLGLNWLKAGAAFPSLTKCRRLAAIDIAPMSTPAAPRTRRLGMLGRLFWQSLRHTWKPSLTAVLISLFLMFAVELLVLSAVRNTTTGFYRPYPLTVFFVPALLGALVFRADQRNRQYCFLAEHAGRPRMIWLARQGAGLLIVVALGAALQFIAWSLLGATWLDRLSWNVFGQDVRDYMDSRIARESLEANVELLRTAMSYTGVVWCFWLTAYAAGQLFSLILRSSVLAALSSVGTALALALWFYAVIAWQLPAAIFILPAAIAALAASWLRIKDWMFDRLEVKRWFLPAVAIVVPIALMAYLVPRERMVQVTQAVTPRQFSISVPPSSLQPMAEAAAKEFAIGRTVMDRYVEISRSLRDASPSDTVPFDEPVRELSEEICRLPVADSQPNFNAFTDLLNKTYVHAKFLTKRDVDAALEMLLAARRIERQYQSGLLLDAMATDWRTWRNGVAGPIWLNWAMDFHQSPERIKRTIDELAEIDRGWPSPATGIVNQYLQARAIVHGQQPPASMIRGQGGQPTLREWLVYWANGLPGETARAERSLDILAAWAIEYTLRFSVPPSTRHYDLGWWRDKLRDGQLWNERTLSAPPYLALLNDDYVSPRYQADVAELRRYYLAAQTSYLAADEMQSLSRVPGYVAQWVTFMARRRLERVRLALVAYHWQNGEYPDKLGQLAPDFLSLAEINDPYSGRPFEYEPHGFDRQFLKFDDPGDAEMFPPGTPLVWSIGESVGTVNERETYIEFTAQGKAWQIVSNESQQSEVYRNARQEELDQTGHTIRRERYLRLESTQSGAATEQYPLLSLPTDYPVQATK